MINYIDYDDDSLDLEINNYLYFLNEVCLDKKNVRRYVVSILRLYSKLVSLSVDYSNEEIESNRTLRKSSRYINKIKKYFKKIKNVDSNVFKEAAERLSKKNGSSSGLFKNRYNQDSWDSERISRTLTGDISDYIKRKRRDILLATQINVKSSSDTIYFDDYNEENQDFSGNSNNLDISNDIDQSLNIESNKLDDLSDSDNESKDETNNLDDLSDSDNELKDESNKIDDSTGSDSNSKDESNKLDDSSGSFSKSMDNKYLQKEETSFDDYYYSDNSDDYVERILIKKELIELKKEIDQNEDLFIKIDHISSEQRRIIKSYISICEKYNKIDRLFHFLYEDASSSDIVNIYKKIYEFIGYLVSEMFEHIIHVSKVECDVDSKTGLYEVKYIMDDSVLDVFGKYDVFIAKIQNYVKLLNEKKGNLLSSSDRKSLSKILWEKYRLEDINPSSIREAVSLDLMSFVNSNPFTLVQTVSSSKKQSKSYKKYDLDKILENVDYSLEKYVPELFESIKNKIMNTSLLSEVDKEYVISNIIMSFSKFIGEIHGLNEYPIVSHDYLISYIMYKVFSVSDNLDSMLKECVQEIYVDENKEYKSLSFFDKIMYHKGKPSISGIEDMLKDFTQEIDNISFSNE